MCRAAKMIEIVSQQEMVLQLACRPGSHFKKSSKVAAPAPSTRFGDVGTDRSGRAPGLAGQPIQFLLRDSLGRTVDGKRQMVGFVPNLELTEILHVKPSISR